MSEKIVQIIEELKNLTLLEASELVTTIEDTFNVDANATVSGPAITLPSSTVEEEIEEKNEFDIVLEEFPSDKKIAVLKIIRGITGLGLKEAKELVESAPKQIQESVSKDVAEATKIQLEEIGAKVSLK